MAIEGAIDGAIFVRWLTEWLVPTLPRGTTVVCDNLSVHHHHDVRPAVEAAGCHLRYLPPYSPDFNPIEHVFSMLKAHLRAAARRSFATLVPAIGAALDAVTPDHLAHCYRHCGYRLTRSPSQPL